MASSLIAKRLAKLEIGTNVELSVEFSTGDSGISRQQILGEVTDNDFQEFIQITSESGEDAIFEYGLIKGIKVISGTVTAASLASSATKVVEAPKSNAVTVQNAAVKAVVQQPSYPAKDYLWNRAVSKLIEDSDYRLQELFSSMESSEQKLLTSSYERFRYGLKISDFKKMTEAGKQASSLFFSRYDNGESWSDAAILFIGGLVHRCRLNASEIFDVGCYDAEVSYLHFCNNNHTEAAVHATLSLLNSARYHAEDLINILARCILQTKDVSALKLLSHRISTDDFKPVKVLVLEMLDYYRLPFHPAIEMNEAICLLESQMPNHVVADEVLKIEGSTEETADSPEDDSKQNTVSVLPVSKPAEVEKPAAMHCNGFVCRQNWFDKYIVVKAFDGSTYQVPFDRIQSSNLKNYLINCMKGDLDGKKFCVQFQEQNGKLSNVTVVRSLTDLARQLLTEVNYKERFTAAYELCEYALDQKRETARALDTLVTCSAALNKEDPAGSYSLRTSRYCMMFPDVCSNNPTLQEQVARIMGEAGLYKDMLANANAFIANTDINFKSDAQKIALFGSYLSMCSTYYEKTGDKSISKTALRQIARLEKNCTGLSSDSKISGLYSSHILAHKVIFECVSGLFEAAEQDFAKLSPNSKSYKKAGVMLDELRPQKPAEPEAEAVSEQTDTVSHEQETVKDADDDRVVYSDAQQDDEEDEENMAAYVDAEGWPALKLTKRDVAEFAFRAAQNGSIPVSLTYLRAAAGLNEPLRPLYRFAAMAANDPATTVDYGINTLENSLYQVDGDYPVFSDYCLGAAFLRSVFRSSDSCDYREQTVRSSISAIGKLPSFKNALALLDEFRSETGCSILLYTDWQDEECLRVDFQKIVKEAAMLYEQFILTPPRENASFRRILNTKSIIFSRSGDLAQLLQAIKDNNTAEMNRRRPEFSQVYLNGSEDIDVNAINNDAIQALIDDSWDKANAQMSLKKNADLQGDRRNNLACNIRTILEVVCRWYAKYEELSAQERIHSTGAQLYPRLKPQLQAELATLADDCSALMEGNSNTEECAGLALLHNTAKELSERLDGAVVNRKYFYADFLLSGEILLDESGIPDLESTFCALKELNMLARIRRHLEGKHSSYQKRIQQIYSKNNLNHDYRSAAQIVDYLNSVGVDTSALLPEKTELFEEHSRMQAKMAYESFQQLYALARNRGQIMQTDHFCYTLEDTIHYWYLFAKDTKQFGFFNNLLLQAQEQIRIVARQYEKQLEEQLDAMIHSNPKLFEQYPDYEDALRDQIAQQNFIVAEDSMHRIREHDFSLNIQPLEALTYLNDFWSCYSKIYPRVADTSRSMMSLLSRERVHNKDTKAAQQMIENWLLNGLRSNSDKICRLMKCLGWDSITVEAVDSPQGKKGEFYRMKQNASFSGSTPLHPIAAFGSEISKNADGVLISCLYGLYNCDRLFEKLRELDSISGSKIILVDYALGDADRRALTKKIKNACFKSTYLIIDRVMVCYFAEHYNVNLINRIVMAVGIPFTYCQPFVAESSQPMPPEIFIGRKMELAKIEASDGVNLIYGGRQLGKSALLKKAKKDIECSENRRAVYVDISNRNCNDAALRLSEELCDMGILAESEETNDWHTLCRSIRKRLDSNDAPISYLLIMLDEADQFITDCGTCAYAPLVELKQVQQLCSGKFKFVLAGLHDVVRFNRDVALGRNAVITHFSSLKINPFGAAEAEELLTMPLSYLGFSFPNKVTVSQILATVNYFPGLIQLYGQKLVESIQKADYAGYDIRNTPPYVVTDQHISHVMADKLFVHEIHDKFEATLLLDEYYQPIALLMGYLYYEEMAKDGYSASKVFQTAKDLNIIPLLSLTEEKVGVLMDELRDLNILRNCGNDHYLLSSKNFRDLLGTEEQITNKLDKLSRQEESDA